MAGEIMPNRDLSRDDDQTTLGDRAYDVTDSEPRGSRKNEPYHVHAREDQHVPAQGNPEAFREGHDRVPNRDLDPPSSTEGAGELSRDDRLRRQNQITNARGDKDRGRIIEPQMDAGGSDRSEHDLNPENIGGEPEEVTRNRENMKDLNRRNQDDEDNEQVA
jgi:hypothetical protein